MYRLIRFGTTNLEYYNQVDTIGSGATPVSYFILPEGGALDGYGSADKQPGVVERVKTMRLTASTEAALESLFYGLMALRGKRDKLYRRSGRLNNEWTYARLTEIVASRDYQLTQFQWMQDIELHFSCQDGYWRGQNRRHWTLNSGVKLNSGYALNPLAAFALAASPAAISVTVGAATDAGRAAVRILKINVLAGANAMSAITIARAGGESLTYSGTIPSGGTLAIDTGTMQVSCTGVTGAYDNLAFDPAADMTAWMTLQPGVNPFTVTYTGGGSGKSIEIIYNEAWY